MSVETARAATTKFEPTTKRARSNPDDFGSDDNNLRSIEVSYVEFFSGIGGWTMALEEAVKNISGAKFTLRRIAALDHSDLCTQVFEHNFGSDKRAFCLERLTRDQVEEWNSNIWAMSPPCQPHTRQHSKQEEDLSDPRSKSFLHLVNLLRDMKDETLPSIIFLENVVGFESSNTFKRWQEALEFRQYRVLSFHLSPPQVGLPNDRPRHFSVAIRQVLMKEPTSLGALKPYCDAEAPQILKAIPELNVEAEDDIDHEKLPCLSNFLDKEIDHEALALPEKVVKGDSGWCLDIVGPLNQRTACFTSAYGRFIRGTGSVIYHDESAKFQLMDPKKREFCKDWAASMDLSKFRYFSGTEMTRLMGFPSTFSFPASISQKQRWKLIGNSLNVRLASRVVELGLKLLQTTKSTFP